MNNRNWVFGALFVWSLVGAVVVAGLATRDQAAAQVGGASPSVQEEVAAPKGGGGTQVPTLKSDAQLPNALAPSAPVPKAMPWEATFEKAMARSRSEGKPVMVDFYTQWCGACKYLDAKVYTDQTVLGETKSWIVVKVDAEARADVAGAYNVHSYPTIAFLNPDGKPIAIQEGAPQEASVFVQWMRQAYAGFVPPAAV